MKLTMTAANPPKGHRTAFRKTMTSPQPWRGNSKAIGPRVLNFSALPEKMAYINHLLEIKDLEDRPKKRGETMKLSRLRRFLSLS